NRHQRTCAPNDAVMHPDSTPTPWLTERQAPTATPEEQRAAQLTLAHANTPTETHFDSLGRPFLVVADNGAAGKYETRTVLDVEGNVLSILDARGNTTQQDYDVVGRPVRTQNPDSGKCVILADVADKPIRAWDDR